MVQDEVPIRSLMGFTETRVLPGLVGQWAQWPHGELPSFWGFNQQLPIEVSSGCIGDGDRFGAQV